MAITGDLFKGFTFGDISSKTYGVYITQEAAYDSPEKDVETFEIAGRNGTFILDNGRFRNISVSYRCGIAESTEATFESVVRAFRNALSAVAGQYVRLTDDYNPNEYREAAFIGGIDVSMADRRAGEFTVTFDAKPQRFLTSGETAVEVTSGGTLTNPTPFEARPLLQVWGYGDISINGETISIDDTVIGEVTLVSSVSGGVTSFPTAQLNRGDSVTLNTPLLYEAYANVQFLIKFEQIVDSVSVSVEYGETHVSRVYAYSGDNIAYIILWLEPFEIDYLTTTRATENIRLSLTVNYTDGNGVQQADIEYYTVSLTYADAQFALTANIEAMTDLVYSVSKNLRMGAITAYSTKSVLGEPLFFDLDIGEAYKEEDGEIVSVNSGVSFGAELPVLASETNVISFDNTVTKLEIVPRWWEV